MDQRLTIWILCLIGFVVAARLPTPPNPQQFVITAGKPKGGEQIEVTTNYVDRFAGLFRIDVFNDEILTEQAFYYASTKMGYLIYYDRTATKCVKSRENDADMMAEWQTLSFAGTTHSISHGKIECNMWNQTDSSWTWSYLASVKENIPIEILDNSILISVFRNYTTGPAAVPKKLFDLPVPVASCR